MNPSYNPEQPNHNVGPMGMSRDSLNGTMTMTGTNLFPTNEFRRDLFVPIAESFPTEELTPREVNNASIPIQQQSMNPENFESMVHAKLIEVEQQQEEGIRTPTVNFTNSYLYPFL